MIVIGSIVVVRCERPGAGATHVADAAHGLSQD
jgi:hypothetical protein